MTQEESFPPWTTSTGVAVGMSIIFGALIVVGIAGNTMVCLAIYANKKLRKKENFYFVSLAAADLLLCVLVMPFAAYNDIVGTWPFGDYCKMWMSLDIMCCTASILHLCAVSFDRCYHIHYPMQYGHRMTGTKILSAITLVWTLSATIAFAPLAFETHFDRALSAVFLPNLANQSILDSTDTVSADSDKISLNSESVYYRCSFNLEPSYAIISSMVSFYVPSCVMIVAYAKLYKYARRHVRTIRHQLEMATTLLMNVATSSPPPVSKAEEKSAMANGNTTIKVSKRREIGASDSKARVTLGAILGLFIVSWGPFFICNIARSFCGEACVPQSLFVALTWMGYGNSAQNPIIYSIFNRDFRQAFGKILLCGKDKKRPSINEDMLVIANSCNNNTNRVIANGYNLAIAQRLPRLSCSEY